MPRPVYPRPSREDVSELRALAAEAGFALEPAISTNCFRLIDLGIGHAVVNPESRHRRAVFSAREARRYLRQAAGE